MTPTPSDKDEPNGDERKFIASCWRCNKEIIEGEIAWGIYSNKWCSLACKRADEEGDWV